jgi:catechol 2,3-dioxygenase-like lactoylglutathione lyase family enzyme
MARLAYVCVLTDDIERLGAFYRGVLQLEPTSRSAYMEFPTRPTVFSLWSVDEFRQLVGSDTDGSTARSRVMFEFEVDDVDAEFARLRNLEQPRIEFVLEPTTLPWGNRSVYFRDPDGNLVNFLTRATN